MSLVYLANRFHLSLHHKFLVPKVSRNFRWLCCFYDNVALIKMTRISSWFQCGGSKAILAKKALPSLLPRNAELM